MIDEYIRQHGRRLYGLCRFLCKNPADADDLYQETWLKVVKNISRYDPAMAFEPWLTKICVNIYRNTLRSALRSPFLQFSSNEKKDAYLLSVPAPEKEDYTELYDAVDRLPEKQRLAVVLFYFQGMDVAATAAALGVPQGTVKSRLSKARGRLKEVLNETDLRF